MTYKELLEELKKLNSEQLGQDVTVHIIEVDEFISVQHLGIADDHRSEQQAVWATPTDYIVLGAEE